MARSLAGSTVAPTHVLPDVTAIKTVRLPPPGSRTVHSSRRIPLRERSISVAVPQPHGGTVTTIRVPGGTVSTGWGTVSVRVIAADPGGAGHDRSLRE